MAENNGGMSGMPESSGMPGWGGEGSANGPANANAPLPPPPGLRRSGRTANLAAKKAAAEAKEAAEKAAKAHRNLVNALAKQELAPKKPVSTVNSPQVSLSTTRVGARPHGLFEKKNQPSSVNNPVLGTGPGSYSGLPHPPSSFGWGSAPTVPMAPENQEDDNELGNLAGSMGKMGMGGGSRRRNSKSRKSKTKKSRKCNYRKSRKSKKHPRKTHRHN